jgi:hypothetical protein
VEGQQVARQPGQLPQLADEAVGVLQRVDDRQTTRITERPVEGRSVLQRPG